jgi:hypothetical protein
MVSVPGRPSFVYVRVHGNNSEVIEAFNDTVSPILNLAVVLTRDELTPNYYRILRRDVAKYQDWYTPQIGYHAAQHEFGGTGSMGQDIVWIQKQQFVPLEVRPMSTSGSTYQCFVDPEYYQWNAVYQFFSGGSTPDLAFLRPAGNLQGLFLGVYMDGNTDSLQYLTGTQFTHTPWPDNYRALIPTVPTSVGIPLAGILLTHEMTGINWTQIYDTRAILGNGGITGSAGGGGTGNVSGSGTDQFIPRWSGSSALVDSIVKDDGSQATVEGDVLVAGDMQVSGSFYVDNMMVVGADYARIQGQTTIQSNAADEVGLIVKPNNDIQTSRIAEFRDASDHPLLGIGKTTIDIDNDLAVSGTFKRGGVEIDPVGASLGQVLEFDGTKFLPTTITGSGGGSGDMLKSVYDPNNDGIIDIAQGGTNATGTTQARTNLGLGNSAILNVGTTAGTVAAGDDYRFGGISGTSGGGNLIRAILGI